MLLGNSELDPYLFITNASSRKTMNGFWRKMHNEELHNLYSSPSIIRMIKSKRMRLAGHVARIVSKRKAYRILVGKPEGKRPLGRTRPGWVDNIKMDLREMGWNGLDRSDSGYGQVEASFEHSN
jgi:hypothetical protein